MLWARASPLTIRAYIKKYTGKKGLNFGIDRFGKSAPYKDIYKNFELNSENIIKKIKKEI